MYHALRYFKSNEGRRNLLSLFLPVLLLLQADAKHHVKVLPLQQSDA